jgi:DNA polymerase-4
MDAFYASVEQRDNPEFRGKPLAVGGSKERGVVAAASYEARKYGVKSAMSSRLAYRKCPNIIFTKPRFEVYKEVSGQIREIFLSYTDLVEPLALDEAFLDVSEAKKGPPSATLIAKEIKAAIREETGLTASAGISIKKFLAKVASDIDKPDGLYVILPDEVMPFIEKLPIEKFFGVGKVTAEKMHQLGIFFGKDLQRFSEAQLTRHFGKSGSYFHKISQGIDDRPVKPDRIRKSVGAERTFEKDIIDNQEMMDNLSSIAGILAERMRKSQNKGRTITLKLKYSDFKIISRSKTLAESISEEAEIIQHGSELLKAIESHPLGIRLLGLSISNLDRPDEPQAVQLTLEF